MDQLTFYKSQFVQNQKRDHTIILSNVYVF